MFFWNSLAFSSLAGFPYSSAGKESACDAGDLSSIPGLERSPGEGKGYLFQYSGLENSIDCIVHGVPRVGRNWVASIFTCFFYDPMDIGNLTSGFSAFSESSLYIWNFSVHVLLKPNLENFEHYFASVWNECNCVVVWAFFGIAFLWDWNENWPFPVLWPLLSFPNLLPYWVQYFNSIIFSLLESFSYENILYFLVFQIKTIQSNQKPSPFTVKLSKSIVWTCGPFLPILLHAAVRLSHPLHKMLLLKFLLING